MDYIKVFIFKNGERIHLGKYSKNINKGRTFKNADNICMAMNYSSNNSRERERFNRHSSHFIVFGQNENEKSS